MVDDSVAALLQAEPHWRVADCPVPALLHDGYRPDLLASGNKAARLRKAMEAELARSPGDPYACAKLGSLEVSEGNRERGLALLEQGLAQCPAAAHPERYELLLHLALAHSDRAPQEAITLYRQALELPLPPRLTLAARLNLAQLLLGSGDAQGAGELVEDACNAAPELALVWFHRGMVERQRGRLAEAISAYRQAAALDPQAPETQQNLAVCLLLGGDIPGARSGFTRAIALLNKQGRNQEAEALRQQAGSLVKLEAPA